MDAHITWTSPLNSRKCFWTLKKRPKIFNLKSIYTTIISDEWYQQYNSRIIHRSFHESNHLINLYAWFIVQVVANNMQIRCKCHGVSGSCQMKTCWQTAPEFRVVGKTLKHMFRDAVLVNQSNTGNGQAVRRLHRPTKLKKFNSQLMQGRVLPNRINSITTAPNRIERDVAENALFYYQKSPTFCERDPLADVHGTADRRCHRNSSGVGSCSSMCCGRGYNMVKELRIEKCFCKFRWCCQVECKNCRSEEWVSVCKWKYIQNWLIVFERRVMLSIEILSPS